MEALDFTPGQVSYRSGVSVGHIYRMLSGERPNASAITLGKIAEALNTTTDYLLGLSDQHWLADQTSTPRTELEWQLLDDFRKFPEDEQRTILNMVQFLQQHQQRTRHPRIIGDDEGPPTTQGQDLEE